MHLLILPSWYPTTPHDVSGVFFRDQALALLNHGHKVGVIAPHMKSVRTLFSKVKEKSLRHFEIDEGLIIYRKEVYAILPRVPYGNYWLFKSAAKRLFRNYIKHHGKPDIIHAHAAIFGGAVAVDLGEKFGIPVVLTEHSTGFARGVYMPWQMKLAEKAITGSRSRIAVSPSLAELLGNQFAFTKELWKWIPNVVADRFKTPKNFVREDRPVRFMNLALMTTKKGQFDLVEAFYSVVESGLSAELWLAGDGPIREALEEQAAGLGIAKKVKFLGLIAPEKVPNLLSEIDIMVVSSHYETFGVVAAEALMAGVPVIATRCGGPECIVGDGDGALVPPKCPAELCQAMQRVGVELSKYNRKDIAERAKKRFSGPAVAARLTEEYGRVLSDNVPAEALG
ncbi:glycosyltransferase [Marinobacter sp. HN1S83]|uniref:glycosyltransferase n=1 Tax=Marinobacter sp. HN1S83 TaxID=3382301 RepID=UPI00387AC68D